MQLIEKLISVW